MIIGITGWFASGKDTVADYLKQKGFQSFSLSDVLREELDKEGIEKNRQNLLNKGNQLRAEFGTGYLAEQALKKIKEVGGENWVIPAVRQSGEVEALRKDPSFQLWVVAAPIETRFERMKKREKGGEDNAINSIEELQARENLEKAGAKNAPQIDLVVEMADKVIDNSGTFDDLHTKIDKLISEAK